MDRISLLNEKMNWITMNSIKPSRQYNAARLRAVSVCVLGMLYAINSPALLAQQQPRPPVQMRQQQPAQMQPQVQMQPHVQMQAPVQPQLQVQPQMQTMMSGNVQVIELGPNYFTQPNCSTGSCASEGCATGACGYSAGNPPMQPSVAKSRCQPCIRAVDCADNCGGQQTWRDMHAYNFQPLGHGQFQGPVRVPVNREYRVRRGDKIQFTYSKFRDVATPSDYVLGIGDELQIASLSDEKLKVGDLLTGRGAAIITDGTIWLPLVGPVKAAGLTIEQLRRNLELRYQEWLTEPAISIQPIKINTRADDILEPIDARQGITGGRAQILTVLDDGTVRMNRLGPVCVQGLTLDQIKREVNLRYRELTSGIYIEPTVFETAPHFVYVYGQVVKGGRYQLTGPTTVTQALALAEGVLTRGNAREIVIFRRAEDWRYIATRVDLSGLHLGKVPTAADEIEVSDSDLIIVPKTPIARFNDFVEQVFQKGAYGIFPLAQVGTGFNASTSVVR